MSVLCLQLWVVRRLCQLVFEHQRRRNAGSPSQRAVFELLRRLLAASPRHDPVRRRTPGPLEVEEFPEPTFGPEAAFSGVAAPHAIGPYAIGPSLAAAKLAPVAQAASLPSVPQPQVGKPHPQQVLMRALAAVLGTAALEPCSGPTSPWADPPPPATCAPARTCLVVLAQLRQRRQLRGIPQAQAGPEPSVFLQRHPP
jgi:hypothetical protein